MLLVAAVIMLRTKKTSSSRFVGIPLKAGRRCRIRSDLAGAVGTYTTVIDSVQTVVRLVA